MVALSALAALAATCGGESPPADPEANVPAETIAAAPAPDTPAEAETAEASDSRGLPRMATIEATRPRTVSPVSFDRLVALLPEVEGWERDEPRGEQHTTPVAYSTARATYRPLDTEGPSVRLEIVDSGFQPLLLTPHEMFLAPEYEERSSAGSVRASTLGGAPAYSRWDSTRRHAEVVVIVGRRFVVSAIGADVPGLDMVNAVMSRVDLGVLGRVR